jgi:hypothetical protein
MPIALRIVFGIVALVLTCAAGWANFAFYSSIATEAHAQVTFCAIAVCTALLKPSIPAAMSYLPSKGAKAIGYFIVVLAVAFDVIGALGYIEMTRSTATGVKIEASSDYQKSRAEVEELHELFKSYADTRATAEVNAELKAAKATAGNCEKRAHTDACKAVAKLETEAARASARDERERKWQEARSEFDKLDKPIGAADPQAEALAKIARLIGFEGGGLFADYMFRVLIIIMFELGTPYAGYCALHSQAPVKPKSVAPTPSPGRAPPARRPRAAKGSADAVLALLSDLVSGSRSAPGITVSGRKVYAAQRALGQACNGMSGAAINRHLAALEVAGAIALDTAGGRTEIELLG